MSVEALYKHADRIFACSRAVEAVASRCARYSGADQAYFNSLEKGGFHAFNSALRFFGPTSDDEAIDVEYWNAPGTWKSAYGDLMEDIWCFAEDVFGNQFAFAQGGVCWFQNETAELMPLCNTFHEWTKEVLKETNYYTGANIAELWNEYQPEEPLTGRYQLCRITPFVCGGEYKLENVFRYKSETNMTFWGNFALKTKDLPEGAKIKFKFTP